MRLLVELLGSAVRFVDAASAVCDCASRLGTRHCGVFLHLQSGRPALVVDNAPGVPDDHRLLGVSQVNWDHNPVFVAMREHLGSIGRETLDPATFIPAARRYGYTGESFHPFVSPVVGPSGWFGTIMFGTIEVPSPTLERDMAMMATHLSVWCTEHGIAAIPDLAPEHQLSPQQHRIAQLVADGATNQEIADTTRISINTVKAHLKKVFGQLDVSNRVELANALRRLSPIEGIAPGITLSGTVTITYAP